MIRAQHNIVATEFFRWYSNFILKRNFSQIYISPVEIIENKSILYISNHVSWWDGFWCLYVNNHLLKKKFHFMMKESELKKRGLFPYIGGFSIRQSSRSVLESLNYANEILSKPSNMVLMFPQGRLHSIYSQTIRFNRGVEKLLKNDNLQILMAYNTLEFWNQKKPLLYLNLKNYTGALDLESLNIAYQGFVNSIVESHKNKSL